MSSILVVDDCPPVASIVERHLRAAGHEVAIAHDGAAARALIARAVPDCIFLDLMMPVMTGVELAHELKRDPATAAIPIVLLSARVGEGRTHVLSEHDASYSVGKPFTRRQILDALDAVLPRTGVAPAARGGGTQAPGRDRGAHTAARDRPTNWR